MGYRGSLGSLFVPQSHRYSAPLLAPLVGVDRGFVVSNLVSPVSQVTLQQAKSQGAAVVRVVTGLSLRSVTRGLGVSVVVTTSHSATAPTVSPVAGSEAAVSGTGVAPRPRNRGHEATSRLPSDVSMPVAAPNNERSDE